MRVWANSGEIAWLNDGMRSVVIYNVVVGKERQSSKYDMDGTWWKI